MGLSLLVTAGCADHSAKWLGDWEGTANRTAPGTPDDPISHAINTIKLSIRADKTFDLVDAGFAKSGSVRLGADKAFLKVKRILDRPVEQLGSGAEKMNREIALAMQEDGSIKLTDPDGFDKSPITLRRKPQP